MNEVKDRQEGLIDAILVRAGARKLNSPGLHPQASRILDDGENLLKGLALSYGLQGGVKGGLGMTHPSSVLAMGLSSSDFRSALSKALKIVTNNRLTEHAGHRQICRTIELQDFKSREFPNVDTDLSLVEADNFELYPFDIAVSSSNGLSARIRTFGRNVRISRMTIINDDVALVSGVFANAGASASRLEADLVYSLIESNPTLGDSMPMFHADHGNIEASALDETSLGSAMGKLRNMQTPAGALANLPAAFLVVAPGLELAAKKLVHQCDLAISVIASAWLPAGRWYLTADPALAPCVGLLHLRNTGGNVLVGPRQEDIADDGVGIGIRHDCGVVALGRVGIVKGGA